MAKKVAKSIKKQQLIIMLAPADKKRMAERAAEEELTVSEYGRQLIRSELDELDAMDMAQ